MCKIGRQKESSVQAALRQMAEINGAYTSPKAAPYYRPDQGRNPYATPQAQDYLAPWLRKDTGEGEWK